MSGSEQEWVRDPVGERPTGTVTFLFTDIEGSTGYWDAHPSEMGSAVERHDVLLRHVIERMVATCLLLQGTASPRVSPVRPGSWRSGKGARSWCSRRKSLTPCGATNSSRSPP